MNLYVRERSTAVESAPSPEPRWLAPLMRAEIAPTTQACCCPAPAVYAVVVAPTAQLPNPPEILLCSHHLRMSRDRLARSDVGVYDAGGRLVEFLPL
jgi:hypothetical protein